MGDDGDACSATIAARSMVRSRDVAGTRGNRRAAPRRRAWQDEEEEASSMGRVEGRRVARSAGSGRSVQLRELRGIDAGIGRQGRDLLERR